MDVAFEGGADAEGDHVYGVGVREADYGQNFRGRRREAYQEGEVGGGGVVPLVPGVRGEGVGVRRVGKGRGELRQEGGEKGRRRGVEGTGTGTGTGKGQERAREHLGHQCKNLSSLILFFAFSFFAVTKLGNAKRQTSPLRSTVQVVDDSWFFCFFFGF